ncbi:MAG: ATP-binding protein [Chloroflexota bacterium]
MVKKTVPAMQGNSELSLRILIIEDNPGDIIIIRETLKATGARFVLSNATSLKESVDLLTSNPYDVIILDLGLPDSMGLKTLREFLNFEVIPPVIVMTGLDDEETALSSLREGAQDYLVKNRLDSENILRSIKYSIERKKLENLQKKNSNQLAILSETTAALFDGDDLPVVYQMLCRSVRKLVKDLIVFSLEFENEDVFRVSNNEQLDRWADEIRDLTGMDHSNMSFRLSDQKKELSDIFSDGMLHGLDKNMYEIRAPLNRILRLDQIASLSGSDHIYAIGIIRNESYYGGLMIFSNCRIEDDDCHFIENMCRQASLSIHRRIIKRNLVHSEARYQRLSEELEEKVRERTTELEVANVQLKELNATKDKFFNIVAHDLKNPFTSLLGATELLFHNIQNMDREKIRKLAQILNDSAKSGYSILLNLLDWSRSQTGSIKMNLQKIDLRKVIDDNISDVHLNCIDKEITLVSDFSESFTVTADKNMLNTVLRNLLSNAIKFTPRGGLIKVTGEIKNDEVLVSVRDNGIGISQENINKLFRIDSKYSRPGTEKEIGTGLGLKLSREFVEKLGGRIWAESVENHGSCFTFSIPLISHTVSR